MIIRLMDNGREYKAPGSGQSEDTIHLFLSAPESDERQLLQQIPQKIRAASCSLHQMIVKGRINNKPCHLKLPALFYVKKMILPLDDQKNPQIIGTKVVCHQLIKNTKRDQTQLLGLVVTISVALCRCDSTLSQKQLKR